MSRIVYSHRLSSVYPDLKFIDSKYRSELVNIEQEKTRLLPSIRWVMKQCIFIRNQDFIVLVGTEETMNKLQLVFCFQYNVRLWIY